MSGLLLRRALLDGASPGPSGPGRTGTGPSGADGAPGGVVRDVLVEGGRVVAVAEDLDPRTDGRGAAPVEVVDLDGAALLPGLRDEHVHLAQWAAARRRTDVSAADGPVRAAELLAAAAEPDADGSRGTGADDPVLVGRGFRDALWARPPHAQVLDAVLPGRAAVLVSADLHTAWCSTAALRLLGLSSPDGVLREQAAMDVFSALERLLGADTAAADRRVLDAAARAAARGVTGVVDLEHADLVTDWPRRSRALPTGVPLRVDAGFWPDRLEAVIASGLRSGDPLPGSTGPGAGDRLRLGPLKVFVDGSLGTRTAHCRAPYPGRDGGHGVLRTPPAQLAALLRRAGEHGLDVAVHAIGDRAVTVALDAFEATTASRAGGRPGRLGRRGPRGRIEHAQQVDPADLPRFAALGVVASVQPRHAPDDRDAADVHWAGATDRAYPYGALHRAGARLVLGSDAPVAELDPWDAIAAAVHRSTDARPPWHPEQHLPLAAAVAASSGGRRGVEVGDVADLVVTATTPAAALASGGPEALRAMPVLATLVGGAWTHREPALTGPGG